VGGEQGRTSKDIVDRGVDGGDGEQQGRRATRMVELEVKEMTRHTFDTTGMHRNNAAPCFSIMHP
jgi:hypothetical protein